MSKPITYIFPLCVLLIFSGCDPYRVFEENKKLDNNEWDQNKPLVFQVAVQDTAIPYNVYVNVRNAGYYRFSNLYLFINSRFPGGQMQRDTLECILAAPDGRWLGEGLGDIWDNRILFKEGVRFPQMGEYRFELIQAMRINPLPGIMDAGIRIEKAK
ncbi:MAG TPA: gliding motility lipoprotein GldH [Chitinophagaceae bacterium]|nr:gliding motility lipoprotein GldH [Chitinophagaceae bacterium]